MQSFGIRILPGWSVQYQSVNSASDFRAPKTTGRQADRCQEAASSAWVNRLFLRITREQFVFHINFARIFSTQRVVETMLKSGGDAIANSQSPYRLQAEETNFLNSLLEPIRALGIVK